MDRILFQKGERSFKVIHMRNDPKERDGLIETMEKKSYQIQGKRKMTIPKRQSQRDNPKETIPKRQSKIVVNLAYQTF